MTPADVPFNPFPGLRPFEPDEDHLFFGREREIDELLRQLRFNRFLAVVGTSGCGKSSLIRCGLIPALQSGMMSQAGSGWRVSILRPGEDPIGHLAAALDSADVLGSSDDELAGTSRVLVEAALRRGPRGLVEAIQHARIPAGENVLVLVDQFEELLRFQRSRQTPHAREEAIAFVKLLLAAVRQDAVPVFVVITMRSDFIGDCMEYPGLPEALNASQYLVPRLTRDELRAAIAGPVAVAGGEIAGRLVLRLLNDLGTDQDQLPVLQHALMRTWDHWARRRADGEPLDIADYEAVGTLRHALSLHAEEAYAEAGAGGEGGHQIAERIFKALTDTVTDPRGTRRPCAVGELALIAEVPEDAVVRTVEIFRRPGRSFLMPPAGVPLGPASIVDISHESLMRCWTRLLAWAEEERLSATMYVRVSRAAAWYEEGTAGLWWDPELELGLQWRRENRPTAAWARRYAEPFERAMRFLDVSQQERDRLVAQRRAEKRRQWRQLQWTAALLAVLLLIAGTMAIIASRETDRARREFERAEENLRLARAAVDESLAVADREPSRLAADFPEFIRLRRQLLEQAQRFYREFVRQSPASEQLRADVALANLRLAHVDRALASREEAAERYRRAIEQLEELTRAAPDRPEYRQALASGYNWLGETLRLSGTGFDAARDAYDRAMALQDALTLAEPDNTEYRRELARTHYNRGILYAQAPRENGGFPRAEADFQEAIRLLEPLRVLGDAGAAQELGRAYNNMANLLKDHGRAGDALGPYLRAVAIHEGLRGKDPENREYALELVKFYNNLAALLGESGKANEAAARNGQALAIIDDLSRPAPSLSVERADSHTLRASILQRRDPSAALAEYRQALDIYRRAQAHGELARLPEFHLRFGDLIVNLAYLRRERPATAGAREAVSEALDFYLSLARQVSASGSRGEARAVLDTLAYVLPLLPEPAGASAGAVFKEIEPGLRERAASES